MYTVEVLILSVVQLQLKYYRQEREVTPAGHQVDSMSPDVTIDSNIIRTQKDDTRHPGTDT